MLLGHQVGNAALILCEVESTFWRELVCLGHDIMNEVGVADEDLGTLLLLLSVCWVDVIPEVGLGSGSSWKYRTASAFHLPVSPGWLTPTGCLSSAGCADFAAFWEAFIKLKPHICKMET